MSITSVCAKCPNKGCGAFHDKCEKYQEELARYRKYVEEERKKQTVKNALFEVSINGTKLRRRGR